MATKRFDWERAIRQIEFPSHLKACKLVALMMATYASADGEDIFPGTRRLASDCQLSERTVRACLTYMTDQRLIHQRSKGSNFGRQARASVYQLCLMEDWKRRFGLVDGGEQERHDPWAS
jgi:hypothetical protein